MFKSLILSILLFQCFFNKSQAKLDLSSCLAKNWLQCGLTIGTSYFRLHRWNDFTVSDLDLGDGQIYTCNARVKGGFYRWQWTYTATITCPALSSIVGNSDHRKSATGAVENAIQNYFIKIGEAGLLTANRVQVLANLGIYFRL